MTKIHNKELEAEKENGKRARKKYLDIKDELNDKKAELEAVKLEYTKLVSEQEERLDLTNMSILE